MAEKTLTKEEWANVDRVLSGLFGRAELQVDGRKVTFLRVKRSKNSLATMTYVDGVFEGGWISHDAVAAERFFMRPTAIFTYKPAERARLKKMSKRMRKLLGEHFDPDHKFMYFTPYWTSAAQIRRHYEKTFNSIELLKAGSI